MRPVDPVTLQVAARILGCSISSVRRHVLDGRLATHGERYEHRTLSQADVEELAAEVYPWQRHLHDPTSWCVTGKDAAAVMAVGVSRLRVLSAQDRVPYVRHVDGTRLYRRAQLEVLSRR